MAEGGTHIKKHGVITPLSDDLLPERKNTNHRMAGLALHLSSQVEVDGLLNKLQGRHGALHCDLLIVVDSCCACKLNTLRAQRSSLPSDVVFSIDMFFYFRVEAMPMGRTHIFT